MILAVFLGSRRRQFFRPKIVAAGKAQRREKKADFLVVVVLRRVESVRSVRIESPFAGQMRQAEEVLR